MIKFLVKGQNIETLEHEVIAADQIAFVNHDIEDAVRAGVLDPETDA